MIMRKRIKITESQFDRLFTEDTDPILAFQDLEEGDVIYIKDASGSHSFQVIDDLGNALRLASMDVKSIKMGWYFIVSKTEGVQDEDIRMTQVSKNNPETKRNYTIKGVETIKITNRTGVEKDTIIVKQPTTNTINKPKPSQNSVNNKTNMSTDNIDDEDTRRKSLADTLLDLKVLEPKNYYIFDMNGDSNNIILKLNENDGNELHVEVVSSGGSPNRYGNLKGRQFTIPLTMENVSISNKGEGWFNIGLVSDSGNVELSDINNFIKYGSEEVINEPEEGGEGDIIKTKYKLDDYLRDYPEIAKALRHQPKLFGLFNIGDPVGVGTVSRVVNKHKDKVNKRNTGDDFLNGRIVEFRPQKFDISLKVDATHRKLYEKDRPYEFKTLKSKELGVKLVAGNKTNNRIEIEVLEKVGENLYDVEWTYTIKTSDGSKRLTKQSGTIKVTNYNI